MIYPDFQDFRDFPGFPGFFRIFRIFFYFYGVPGVREAFRKLPGAGALHSDRIWAHFKPCGPNLLILTPFWDIPQTTISIGPQFGNSRADFFEPGSKIPLPRSPRADFLNLVQKSPSPGPPGPDLFENSPKIPLPRARSALGAPPEAAPGGFLENFQKNQPPGDLGRAIFEPGSKNQPWGT